MSCWDDGSPSGGWSLRGKGIRSLELGRLNNFVKREERLVDELVSATVWLAVPEALGALGASMATSRPLSVGVDRTSGWGCGVDTQPRLNGASIKKETPRTQRMRTASSLAPRADGDQMGGLIPRIRRWEKTDPRPESAWG
jgi:hypothetical protein